MIQFTLSTVLYLSINLFKESPARFNSREFHLIWLRLREERRSANKYSSLKVFAFLIKEMNAMPIFVEDWYWAITCWCSRLIAYRVENQNKKYKTIDDCVFGSTLVRFKGNNLRLEINLSIRKGFHVNGLCSGFCSPFRPLSVTISPIVEHTEWLKTRSWNVLS